MSNLSSFFTDVIAVSIVLGVMIFVHEWGHFIAAKLSGVRVEVFSLGFGTRLFGVKRGDTDYRVSALPFGGYVRMAGDNPIEERTGADYEFLSKPRWVRVLIACAGPAMNILLAFVIFWGIFWLAGIPTNVNFRQSATVAAVPDNVLPNAAATGDQILEVNGTKTPTWEKVLTVFESVKPGENVSLVVLRNGAAQSLTVKTPDKLSAFQVVGYPPMTPVLDEVAIGSPAEKAGLRAGDLITTMNGKPVIVWNQLVDAVHQSNGKEMNLAVQRDGKSEALAVTPILSMDAEGQMVYQIGVAPKTQDEYERQPFFGSAKDAGVATVQVMKQIAQVLGGLFTGKVSVRQLSGVVGIARVSGQAAKHGPLSFLEFMAAISLNLGLLNLLPIPILDGGHILLLAIEGLLRRDLSIGVKERFVQVGLVFLLGILGFVMYSDILKVIQSHH
ncbi:MAG: RIP metalloprotease RseP [Candidatus Acidiferrales bacterium]